MKKIEFETLAKVGALAGVSIYETTPGKYELWAYPEGTYEGSNTFKTALGETRIWSSLDVLVKFIRTMGYYNTIQLDMSRFGAGLAPRDV
jgi:hypothetical protein